MYLQSKLGVGQDERVHAHVAQYGDQGDNTDGEQCWRKLQNMQNMQNSKYKKDQGDQMASRLRKTECSGLHSIWKMQNNICEEEAKTHYGSIQFFWDTLF